MGIEIIYNPDLALRDYEEYEKGNRKVEECIPKNLEVGKTYEFLKSNQRVYWLNSSEEWNNGEMPLVITKGNEIVSRPVASIKMIEFTHFIINGKTFTKGIYMVIEIFDKDDTRVKFECFKRI
ncbi:hypothetical protein GOV12_02430 [Candidatus Pacearchaeota archaeon]|nr:hypothetical protein [Candidatus Pacearchaeota archaeon]